MLALPSSPGGHLELLLAVEEAYRERPHEFLIPDSPAAERLRAEGRAVSRLPNPGRDPRRLPENLRAGARALRRLRPDTILTSWAGLTIPVCPAAKAAGARLIFVETMARVQDGSATGRLLYRTADHFLVQWPEQLAVYPRAELCRPALLAARPASPQAAGRGTLVSVGNHPQPFARLLRLADEAAARGLLPEPVLAQVGSAPGYEPRHMQAVAFLPSQEMERRVAEAAVLLLHGGAAVVAGAVRAGRTPLVLPRRAALREHVDDHQVGMVAKLASLGLVVSLDDLGVEAALERSARPPQPELPGLPLVRRLAELLGDR